MREQQPLNFLRSPTSVHLVGGKPLNGRQLGAQIKKMLALGMTSALLMSTALHHAHAHETSFSVSSPIEIGSDFSSSPDVRTPLLKSVELVNPLADHLGGKNLATGYLLSNNGKPKVFDPPRF